jgi:heat shock protein HslJ
MRVVQKSCLIIVCLFVIGLSSVLTGCKHRDAALLKGSAWKARSIDGTRVIDNSYISLYLWADGTLWGHGGVNTYDSSWACVGKNHITFYADPDSGGVTMMGGPKELETQEQAYLKALWDAVSYSLEDNHTQLKIYDVSGQERIIFGRLSQNQADPEKLKNTEWSLGWYDGNPVSDNSSMSLIIDADGKMYGQAGPFYYEIGYKTFKDNIRIVPVAGGMTIPTMPNNQLTTAGKALTALHYAGIYNMENDKLIIYSVKGDSAVFQRYHSLYVKPSVVPSLVSESGSASWAYIVRDLGALCADADLIILGTGRGFTGIEEIQHSRGSHYVCKSSFRVEAVLKGVAGREMILNHGVYTSDNITFRIFETNPPIQAGERWILFLFKAEDGNYFETGPWGRYRVEDGKVYSMNRILNDNNIYGADLDFNGFDLFKFLRLIVNQLKSDSLTFYEEQTDTPAFGFGFPLYSSRSQSLIARLDTGWVTSGQVTFVIKCLEQSGSTKELPVPAGLKITISPSQIEVEPGHLYRVVLHADAAMDMLAGIYWLTVECWQENAVLTSREFFVSIHQR